MIYTAFTFKSFHNQERNLMFLKRISKFLNSNFMSVN